MNLKKKLYRKILTLALLAALAIPFVPAISAAAADNEVQTYVLSEIVAEKTIGEVAVIDGNVFFDQDLDLNGASIDLFTLVKILELTGLLELLCAEAGKIHQSDGLICSAPPPGCCQRKNPGS